MSDPVLTRVMGGSPPAVVLRLLLASLVVGALMSWLQIDVADLAAAIERGFVHLWGTGFEALGRVGRTLFAGAAVVLPVWVVLRVLSYRGRPAVRPGPAASTRWPAPERVGEEPRI